MKKYSKLLAVTLCASIALASTGCSATNKLKNAITNKKTTSDTKKESAESVKCLDYVTLGDYSTIKIKKSEIDKSTKEQLEKNIKSTGDYKKVKTGKVKKGDIVAKGDILVSGQLVKSGNEEIEITNQVKSRATIFGKVERIKRIDIPFLFQEKKYTGKVYNTYSLKIFNKKINIDFIDKVRTNSYDKSTEVKIFNLGEGYNLPLVLYNTKYKEYVINNITLNEKQAENKASKLIYNYIINTYPLDSDILNCKIKYVKNNKILSAYAYIISNESIGVENYNVRFLGGNALNDST